MQQIAITNLNNVEPKMYVLIISLHGIYILDSTFQASIENTKLSMNVESIIVIPDLRDRFFIFFLRKSKTYTSSSWPARYAVMLETKNTKDGEK